MTVRYPAFEVSLSIQSATRMIFEIKDGPFARTETVDIETIPLGDGQFAVSWQEASGATVTNIQDYDRMVVHSFATLPDHQFIRMTGPIEVTKAAPLTVGDARPNRNKALVIEAMTSLFQRHDADTVERLYAPGYIQHNPNISQGRDTLQAIVEGLSSDVYYEPGLIIAEGDYVAIHGRIRGWAERPQVVVDIFRIENGRLAEHWDVLQDEVAAAKRLPAFRCSTQTSGRAKRRSNGDTRRCRRPNTEPSADAQVASAPGASHPDRFSVMIVDNARIWASSSLRHGM
ncbi:nuclear transport factor 2 family protein [Aureimonas altamirensis]|uniref:nuclear transport factor 2 family protein n=1 Tax=Aureimonas altamirensis TaxID=370622 RepID=UPI001E44F349|nr:nuclear transport factor 2 family protein [Aureimonas altamirensis]UHD47662.1 nuclear transport factor 2 family protein [Aureimonas altamirensis]